MFVVQYVVVLDGDEGDFVCEVVYSVGVFGVWVEYDVGVQVVVVDVVELYEVKGVGVVQCMDFVYYVGQC